MSVRRSGSDESGVAARLRRYQERIESLVTRVLLLGIFATGLTAQFVKPVADALEGKAYLGGALLSLVGYVLYDQLKELSASVRAPASASVSSFQLGNYVSDAFRARKVEVSFLGYTGETLYHALYDRLEGLLVDPGPVHHVQIRMLVPDFEQQMAVPSKVGDDDQPVDDPEFRGRMERQCREYDGILSQFVGRLAAGRRVTVECEYRVYQGIPRDKICIFNRELVLHGLYDVSARMQWQDAEYYDPKGYRTDLNVWSRDGTAAAEDALSQWNKHFDDLWSLATRPVWRQGA
ncbi:hypothetical protein [Streptomyces dysideae]|uniref:Uncharacterized protein n=1 Tax=Streptomyces dysideae TaxID=909626 RepID=A0A101V160_9ACTN|nr:hypothetical protein [Streptomyces dysideae]KUO20621.1 hypothetical protein AQJ91_13765 [Streptomyces dysideae]